MNGAMWWIDRWRKSSAYTDMTAEEQGLYRNLLDEMWLRPTHAIPNDPRILMKVSGDPEAWSRCGKAVLARLELTEQGWTHPTALEVIRQAESRSERQRRYRERNAQRNGERNGERNADHNDACNKGRSPSPSPSPSPDQYPSPSERTENARSQAARAPLTTGGVMAGTLPRDHLRCAFCWRRCVPQKLHAEFVQQWGGSAEKADRELRAWYVEVAASVGDEQPIGDDQWDFWRAQIRAKLPSAAPPKPSASGYQTPAQEAEMWRKVAEAGPGPDRRTLYARKGVSHG